jgi:hypothetical protein
MNDCFAAALDISVCFWYSGNQVLNGKTCCSAPSNDGPIVEDRHLQKGFHTASFQAFPLHYFTINHAKMLAKYRSYIVQ